MTGSFVHIHVYDATAGLLTVLERVPRGWGRARLDLASEFAGGEGVAWRDQSASILLTKDLKAISVMPY